MKLLVSFNRLLLSVNEFMAANGFEDFRLYFDDGSSLMFIGILSLLASIIGSAFLFPIFQYVSIHSELSLDESSPSWERSLHHGMFFAPMSLFLSFTKPVAERILEMNIVSSEQYKVLQIIAIFVWVVSRFISTKIYLQKFLDHPLDRFNEFKQLKEEECRRKVTFYICYFCAAFLQYILPVSITFLVALLLKSLGGISFSSLWTNAQLTKMDPTLPSLSITDQFMSPEIQRPFWSLLLVILLGMHSLLNIISAISKKTFAQTV